MRCVPWNTWYCRNCSGKELQFRIVNRILNNIYRIRRDNSAIDLFVRTFSIELNSINCHTLWATLHYIIVVFCIWFSTHIYGIHVWLDAMNLFGVYIKLVDIISILELSLFDVYNVHAQLITICKIDFSGRNRATTFATQLSAPNFVQNSHELIMLLMQFGIFVAFERERCACFSDVSSIRHHFLTPFDKFIIGTSLRIISQRDRSVLCFTEKNQNIFDLVFIRNSWFWKWNVVLVWDYMDAWARFFVALSCVMFYCNSNKELSHFISSNFHVWFDFFPSFRLMF